MLPDARWRGAQLVSATLGRDEHSYGLLADRVAWRIEDLADGRHGAEGAWPANSALERSNDGKLFALKNGIVAYAGGSTSQRPERVAVWVPYSLDSSIARPIDGVPCGLDGGIAWLRQRGKATELAVWSPPESEPHSIAMISSDVEPMLVCAGAMPYLILEGSESSVTSLVAQPFGVARTSGGEGITEQLEYAYAEGAGIVRSVTNSLELSEGQRPIRKLRYHLSEGEELAAVETDGPLRYVVLTKDVHGCGSDTGQKSLASIALDMRSNHESYVPLGHLPCGVDAPALVAAPGGVLIVLWVDLREREGMIVVSRGTNVATERWPLEPGMWRDVVPIGCSREQCSVVLVAEGNRRVMSRMVRK